MERPPPVRVRGDPRPSRSHSVRKSSMFEYCYLLVIDGGALNQGSAGSTGFSMVNIINPGCLGTYDKL